MKHLVALEHSSFCCDNGKEDWCNPRRYCELNPRNFLIYVHGDFYLLSVSSCMIMGSDCEYLQYIIENGIKKKS